MYSRQLRLHPLKKTTLISLKMFAPKSVVSQLKKIAILHRKSTKVLAKNQTLKSKNETKWQKTLALKNPWAHCQI